MLRLVNCGNRSWLDSVEHACGLGDVLFIDGGFFEVFGISKQEGSNTVCVEVEPWDGNTSDAYFQPSLFEWGD